MGLSRRQELQRQKTLRSLPNGKPYFDNDDITQIANSVEPRFQYFVWLREGG